jgi:hypothetical protein
MAEQVVVISARATAFTAICEECSREAPDPDWAGASFAAQLDLDLDAGVFLCRRGHTVRIRRARAAASAATEAA